MHLTAWQVYLWLKLDDLDLLLSLAAFACFGYAFIVFVVGINLAEYWEEFTDFIKKFKLKLSLFMMLIFFVLDVLLPSTKQFALIYVLPKIANSKTVQSLLTDSDDVGTLLVKYAKQELKHKVKEELSKEGGK